MAAHVRMATAGRRHRVDQVGDNAHPGRTARHGPEGDSAEREGEYRYELVQDLRSQLLEEELRNRDRNASLLALDREMNRYRPYLSLSWPEVQARAKTAPPEQKKILEDLSLGWG